MPLPPAGSTGGRRRPRSSSTPAPPCTSRAAGSCSPGRRRGPRPKEAGRSARAAARSWTPSPSGPWPRGGSSCIRSIRSLGCRWAGGSAPSSSCPCASSRGWASPSPSAARPVTSGTAAPAPSSGRATCGRRMASTTLITSGSLSLKAS